MVLWSSFERRNQGIEWCRVPDELSWKKNPKVQLEKGAVMRREKSVGVFLSDRDTGQEI